MPPPVDTTVHPADRRRARAVAAGPITAVALQLHVAEQGGDRTTVQANFTETYDSGSTRNFIGYWRLVRVEGRWLLDEPHY